MQQGGGLGLGVGVEAKDTASITTRFRHGHSLFRGWMHSGNLTDFI